MVSAIGSNNSGTFVVISILFDHDSFSNNFDFFQNTIMASFYDLTFKSEKKFNKLNSNKCSFRQNEM